MAWTDEELEEAVARATKAAAHAPAEMRHSVAAELVRLLLTDRSASHSSAGRSENVTRGPVAEPTPRQELPELMSRLQDNSHPDRLVVIAAYRYETGNDTTTADDFRAAYSDARVPLPQNLAANIARCLQRGWLVASRSAGGKAWRITQSGMRHYRETSGMAG